MKEAHYYISLARDIIRNADTCIMDEFMHTQTERMKRREEEEEDEGKKVKCMGR